MVTMPVRNRSSAEIAGTFLLWVEEYPSEDPPWRGYVVRRPYPVIFTTPDGEFVHTTTAWQDHFPARTEAIAKQAAALTVENVFPDYAHRVHPVEWVRCDHSQEQWESKVQEFMRRPQP
jgi:hypothetical protein